jgi:hypothetical protein
VPALGTLAIVLAGSQSPLNARVLASRPLVGIGLISLALYLWHWPLLVFARILWPDGLSVGVRLIVLALSFLLAALSTRWVERPVRARSRNGEAVALGAAIAGVAVIGIAIAQEDGLPGRDAARNAFELSFENAGPDYAYMTRHDLFRAYRDECNFVESRSVTVRDRIPEHCFVPTTARSLFLWGDSFAQHLYIGLSHRLPADVSILQVTTSGCWPRTVDVEPDVFNACNKSNRFALEQIRRVRPQVVVLAQNREHEKNDYAETARVLRASGVGHVVVVGPAPQWNPPLYKVIASRYWIHTPERIRTGLIETIFQTDRVFKAGYASPLATYVSLLDGNCDPEGCIAYFGSDREIGIFTFDNGHLTPLSSDYVAAGFLMPVLGPLLSMPVAPLSTTDTDGMAPRPIAIDVTKSPQR